MANDKKTVPSTIEEMESNIKAMSLENAQLKKEIASLRESIKAQKNASDEPAAITMPSERDNYFEHKGKAYKMLIARTFLNGVEITATDVLADEDLQTQLVEMEAGCIAEIAKK